MTRPGSCSNGLRSLPSTGGGKIRSKGFEVNSVNSSMPTLTSPSMPSTRAAKASGNPRLAEATASVQPARISIHSSSDPSWPPQTAAIL